MSDYNADEFPALNKIRTIAFDYNFAPESKLKVDQFSTDSDLKVYHIVRKIGSTNLSFLVDPTEVPG